MSKKRTRARRIRKVLVLGSGALKIGEAGEFDYSGSQALKALKEEGIKTILVNPNIATIQTSEGVADKTYLLPVTAEFVEQVIKKEKPDSILLSFGGQTALNCGLELYKKGVLKRCNVLVLGTPIETIVATEDRDLFVKKLKQINAKTPKSHAACSVEEALEAAEKIGYPVMVRIAYALGGLGSGIAKTRKSLEKMAKKAFAYTSQILVEEYLNGWKEIEYEVVRDSHDNCITVCNMENMDPMGIHTGESIVVAPSQTLTNNEYHKLREIAIKVIRHLGIVGECNIQYALAPDSDDYRIIEVNARLSRSSALASKATGYPLAFIAAKLALGYSLTELKNSVTKKTTACFEPALDYCVVKIPRWDLKKFVKVSKKLGSAMMSVGEVMAIGRKFEEALQKALRMLEIGVEGLACHSIKFKDLDEELKKPTDERVFAIALALKKGYSINDVHKLTKIDKWFLHKISNIVETEKKLKAFTIKTLPAELLYKAKTRGFSDRQIAITLGCKALDVKLKRLESGIVPYIKQIDTLAAEYPAKTNYMYLTYNASKDDITFEKRKKVIVLGSGSYRIGSSVEFDWCCVNAVNSLKKLGYETIMINYNPETVSTDYDSCDKLYFDEISIETVMAIYGKEKPYGIIISTGGQIANNLALKLRNAGAKILGTSAKSIDNAEDRYKFSKLLDENNIDQPEWKELSSVEKAKEFAKKVGYPVLIRPSYVLSGAAMSIAYNPKDLVSYLKKATGLSRDYPVVISKFITNAKEIEIDAVAKDGRLLLWAISEHIEKAGVHSGDATLVFPPQNLYLETVRRIKKTTEKIAESLKITGPFNIQYLARDNELKVIECNLRASRSFPFVSKVSKINFIDYAVKAMLGKRLQKPALSTLDIDYVGIKCPQFSFTRLKKADPILGVEMASTGEVACIGYSLEEAFLKAMLSVGVKLPKKNILLSLGSEYGKFKLLEYAKRLSLSYNLFATDNTHEFLKKYHIKSRLLTKCAEKKPMYVLDAFDKGIIDFAIIIPSIENRDEETIGYKMRRKAVDFAVPLITDISIAKVFINAAINSAKPEIIALQDYKRK